MPNPAARFSRSVFSLSFEWCLRFSVLFVFLAAAVLTRAQSEPAQTGVVTGRVSSQLTGAYLANARVTLEGGSQEAITDANGSYRLSDVPAGSRRVSVYYVGLAGVTGTVTVVAGHTVPLDFDLDRTSGQTSADDGKTLVLEKFEVLSDREESAQMRAMNQQRQSPNIKNVVAYDEYPTAGNDNIGEYMRFIPGLSLNYPLNNAIQDATGVSVRGMPPGTTGITIDGLDMVGTTGESATRGVSLAAVPTSNVATIEVTKVPTPDMSAAGLGGSVNITTKSGFERTKSLFTYDLHATFNPDLGLDRRPVPDSALSGRPVRPSFRLGYILPVNKSLSITANLSQENTYAETSAATSGWNLIRGYQSSNNLVFGFGEVTVTNARLGVDWKIGPKHIFGASYSYRKRDALQGTPAVGVIHGTVVDADATTVQSIAAGTGSISTFNTVRQVLSDNRRADFKYKYLGDDWRVDFGASYSKSKGWYALSDDVGYFNGSRTARLSSLSVRSEGIDGTADTPAGLLQKSVVARDRGGNVVDYTNQGLYEVSAVTTIDSDDDIGNGQLKLDVRREMKLGIPLTFRTGLAYTTTRREIWNASKSYTFRSTAAERLASNYDLIDTDFTLPDVFGRPMQLISQRKLYDLYRSTPSYFALNETASWQSNVNGTKRLDEDIPAAYLRLDTRLFQNRLWLVGGVRYERTEDYGEGPLVDPTAQYVRNPDGTLAKTSGGAYIPITTDPLEAAKLVYVMRGTKQKTTYDNFFPSLNATYSLTKDLLVRAGYAGTIGRPDLAFIIPGITYGNPSPATNTQTITVVNTRLKPWTADNLDLTLEAYMFKGGFGSVGVFQKDISNFFVATSQPGTPELLEQYGIVADENSDLEYTIVSRGNGGDARVRGLEITYRQSLFFLPQWASGFQVFANYTRSDLSGSNVADFTGFNPETLSWGVNLNRKRFLLKFNATQQGETKRGSVAVNSLTPAGTYDYQAPLKSYVLSGEVRINKHLSVYATWSNFNEQGQRSITYRYTPGSTPDELKTYSIVERGSLVVVGIKGSF